jgi:acetyl esterase/lipase
MALHPQVEALLDQIAGAGLPPISALSVAEARALGEQTAAMAGEQVPVAATRDITIPVEGAEIPARVYTPDGAGPHPVVVFFHGGGFVICSPDTHDNAARSICRDAAAVVVSVDYRMAPEHPFPVAPQDCFGATRWVAEHAAELGADASLCAATAPAETSAPWCPSLPATQADRRSASPR